MEQADIVLDNGVVKTFTKREYAEYLIRQHFKNCKILFLDLDKLGDSTVDFYDGVVSGRTIRLNSTAVELFTFKELRQLVLHEIAHQYTPYHQHDKVYYKKAREIGVDDDNVGSKFYGAPFWKVAKAIHWKKYKSDKPVKEEKTKKKNNSVLDDYF